VLSDSSALLRGICSMCVLCTDKTKNYVFTKKMYQPATENSPLFAVDCEMVSTMTLRSVIYAFLFTRSILFFLSM